MAILLFYLKQYCNLQVFYYSGFLSLNPMFNHVVGFHTLNLTHHFNGITGFLTTILNYLFNVILGFHTFNLNFYLNNIILFIKDNKSKFTQNIKLFPPYISVNLKKPKKPSPLVKLSSVTNLEGGVVLFKFSNPYCVIAPKKDIISAIYKILNQNKIF